MALIDKLRKFSRNEQAEYDTPGNVLWDVSKRIIPGKVYDGLFVVLSAAIIGSGVYVAGSGLVHKIEENKERNRIREHWEEILEQENFIDSRQRDCVRVGKRYLDQGLEWQAECMYQKGIAIGIEEGNEDSLQATGDVEPLRQAIIRYKEDLAHQAYIDSLREEFNNGYVVREGDDLWNISRKYWEAFYSVDESANRDITPAYIERRRTAIWLRLKNDLRKRGIDPDNLEVGQILHLSNPE